MLDNTHRQHGVTLIELMVASALGLVAMAAVLTAYETTLRHSTAQLNTAHLNQQLRGLLHLISTDIRRAGYWRADVTTQSASENPFSKGMRKLQVAAFPGEKNDSCITLAYDLDGDGLAGIGQCDHGRCPKGTDSDNNEQFGFRLRNLSIQSRYGGSKLSCDGGHWQTMNDSDVEITELLFEIQENCVNLLDSNSACSDNEPKLTQNAVHVRLSGQLINRPDTETRLQSWIIVRNDSIVDAAK